MEELPDYLRFEPGSVVKLTGGTLDLGVIYDVPLRGWRRWLYRLTRISWPTSVDRQAIQQKRDALVSAFSERFEEWI